MSNERTEKKSARNLTITDLNEDCMRRMCSNLREIDKIILMLASDRIVNILSPNIDLAEIKEYLNLDVSQIKDILSRAGPHIKKLHYEFVSDIYPDSLFEIISHAGKCCPNITQVDLNFCYGYRHYDDRHCPENLFAPFQQIKILQLRNCLSDECIKDISTLPNLKHLDLSYNDRINGKYLGNLKNIQHLNLSFCKNLESENFIAFCSTNKLKELRILSCKKLNDSAIDAMIKTQTDLEKIALNNRINADAKRVLQLRNLKHLYFRGCSVDLVTEAVRLQTDLTETVVFRVDRRRPYEACKIKNLKKFIFDVPGNVSKLISNIAYNCNQLEECLIRAEYIKEDAILRLINYAQHLKILGLPSITITMFHAIVTVIEKRNSIPLKIFTRKYRSPEDYNYFQNYFQTEEYLRSKDFVVLTLIDEFMEKDPESEYNKYFGHLLPVNEDEDKDEEEFDYDYLTMEKYAPA